MSKPRHLRSVAAEAERIGVSSSWLYGEIRVGRFPHIRLGNRVLLDPNEVDHFLALRTLSVEDAIERVIDLGVWSRGTSTD